MSFQSFPYNFPTAALALVDPKSGQPTNFFWQFLLSLFNRTGSSDGISPIVNSTKAPQTPLTATGNSQATALALGADWNEVATVPPGSGVAIPSLSLGNDISVWNSSANTLLVYPPSGLAIGGLNANAGYSLGAGLLAYFQCWRTTLIIPIIKVNPLTL